MNKQFSLIGIFLLIFIFTANSQIVQPVKWTYSVENVNGTQINLIMTATIDESWQLYGQGCDPAGGIPVSFILNLRKILN